MYRQKILKVGNSIGITLPSEIVKNLSLKAGDHAEVTLSMTNELLISFPDSHQLTLGLKPIPNKKQKSL